MELKRIGNALRTRARMFEVGSDGASSSTSSSLAVAAKDGRNNRTKKIHDGYDDATLAKLFSDPRYQPTLLAAGQRKYAAVNPPRGTLNDDKLEYLTWRMLILFVHQAEHERLFGREEENVVEQEQSSSTHPHPLAVSTAQHARTQSTTTATSSFSSAPSSNKDESSAGKLDVDGSAPVSLFTSRDSRSSASSARSDLESVSSSSQPKAAAAAMVRLVGASNGGTSTDDGRYDTWLDMQTSKADRLLAAEEANALDDMAAVRTALIENDAMAAIPLLEREERTYVRERYDEDGSEREGEAMQAWQESESDPNAPLPPPLYPASMFYRVSFGIRPSRSTSSSSGQQRKSNAIQQRPFPLRRLRSLFGSASSEEATVAGARLTTAASAAKPPGPRRATSAGAGADSLFTLGTHSTVAGGGLFQHGEGH